MSFLHSDGLLKWDKSNLYQSLQTAQAWEVYGMRKIADWALHILRESKMYAARALG